MEVSFNKLYFNIDIIIFDIIKEYIINYMKIALKQIYEQENISVTYYKIMNIIFINVFTNIKNQLNDEYVKRLFNEVYNEDYTVYDKMKKRDFAKIIEIINNYLKISHFKIIFDKIYNDYYADIYNEIINK